MGGPGGRILIRTCATMFAVTAALAWIGLTCVYVLSELQLSRAYDAPLIPFQASSLPDLAEGERMARIVGCWNGCHGRRGEGGHEQIKGIARNTAPTLSQVLPFYSDEELVRLLRFGVKRDGHSALGMNSWSFWFLGDRDLANIIAHLRRQPTVPPIERTRTLSWRGRLALINGTWAVSAELVDRSRPRWGNQPRATAFERGRYLASITCSECHGLDFNGNALEGAPSLAIVGAYSPQQFVNLVRTAKPLDGRALDDDMSWLADAPFSDTEIADLYAFLRQHHGMDASLGTDPISRKIDPVKTRFPLR